MKSRKTKYLTHDEAAALLGLANTSNIYPLIKEGKLETVEPKILILNEQGEPMSAGGLDLPRALITRSSVISLKKNRKAQKGNKKRKGHEILVERVDGKAFDGGEIKKDAETLLEQLEQELAQTTRSFISEQEVTRILNVPKTSLRLKLADGGVWKGLFKFKKVSEIL